VVKVCVDAIYKIRYDDDDDDEEELDADEVSDLLIQEEPEMSGGGVVREDEGGTVDKEAEERESETGSPQKATGANEGAITEEGE
jgi:hypothetical protein